jgi:hypothetical protein
MTPTITKKWIWALLIGALLTTTEARAIETRERLSLSVPNLQIGKRERIVEFRVTIAQGSVASVPRIPPGWFLHIDLPFQWKTVVTAGSVIGVADLTSNKVEYFNDFLIIVPEQHPDLLSVEVEIVTNTFVETMSSINEKRRLFEMKDLKLKKATK